MSKNTKNAKNVKASKAVSSKKGKLVSKKVQACVEAPVLSERDQAIAAKAAEIAVAAILKTQADQKAAEEKAAADKKKQSRLF